MSKDLTREEAGAIRGLERLARRWPPTLMLLSYGDSLSVIHTADLDAVAGGTGPRPRQDLVIADIDGIPNDGGT